MTRRHADAAAVAPRHGRPLFVLSDVHLGAVPAGTERALRSFLAHVGARGSALLVNGDLFDVWLATRHLVVGRHVRVLAALADLVDAGVPVLFVGGNHDALEYGGDFLRDELGVTTLDEPARVEFGGRTLLVVHGDGVRPGRPGYRKRHPVLRSRAFRAAAQRVVHPDRIVELVARASGTPRLVAQHALGEGTGPKPAAPLVEGWARRALADRPEVDVAVAGHSHLPALVEVDAGRFYVNAGDWISHMSYATVAPERGTPPALGRWPAE